MSFGNPGVCCALSLKPAFLYLLGQGDSRPAEVSPKDVTDLPAGIREGGSLVPLPVSAEARGPEPREGEGSPRHKPASAPAQNRRHQNFFHQPRETCPFRPARSRSSSSGRPGFPPPTHAASPGVACGGPGADPRAGRLGGHGGGEGKGDEEGGGGSGRRNWSKGTLTGECPESDGAVCCSRNKVRALSSAFRSLPSALPHSFDSWA